jgi:mycothiol system anti-sigma-R factor
MIMDERYFDDEGCRDALHRLYDYLDGELTDERRRLIRDHLDECSPCLEVFDFEAELRNVVATKCREQVPDSLKQRIADALQHPQRGVAGGFDNPTV